MDTRLIGLVLLVTVALAQDHDNIQYDKRGAGVGQAFSYSHVIHDHGPPVPHHVGDSKSDEPTARHHYPHTVYQTITKEVPYPVLQPYAITVEKHIPYTVNVPVAVPVDRPYPVPVPKPYPVTFERPVPVTVEKPYPYAVKYPVKVAVPTPVPVAVPKPYPVYLHSNFHDKIYSDNFHDKTYNEGPQYDEDERTSSEYSSSAEEENDE